jgi:hypothetical protein
MQTDAQKLVVVRDQFALKGLSDDVLKQILPAYQEAIRRLEFLLANLPHEGASIARELWLRTQLATIRAQFGPVADRIYQILPEAQARAFEEGLSNAQKYLEAGGITPQPAQQATLAGVTTGGQQVSVSGNLPGFNVTNALEKGFISPSITRQQVIAAARETGFSVLSPGGSKYGLAELLSNWMNAQSKQVERHLRSGFLVGMTNDEIMREIGPLGPGRRGWAMTEAVVRTSMAEASQSAHDAFYEANADLLPGTKSGYRWWWDASNDTRLCPLCAPLDGVKFKERDKPPAPWPRHFSCRCKLLPWTATQELLEEEDGPASGSFLEATPVQYDKRGKRLPPPDGYTGDNAYKRPMKVDGQMQWVRRRDLGPGQTTAGDMLQNANEHSKRLVLGKHTEEFNKLTGPGGRYEKNPQGAVRELLGKGLPPGSTAPRPVRGPKPKPPAPKPTPAPKQPPPAPKPTPSKPPAPPKTQASFNAETAFEGSTDSLGRGMFGEARLTNQGVAKKGYIGKVEYEALTKLAETGVTPRPLDIRFTEDKWDSKTFPGLTVRRGYMLMERCPGAPLVATTRGSTNVVQMALTPKESEHVFEKMMQARKAIHLQGVAHQDMHAANVMYDKATGRLTVIDLGTARLDARAALIEALGTKKGKMLFGQLEEPGDYQSRELFQMLNPGNLQAKNATWKRFAANRAALIKQLKAAGLDDILTASIRRIPRSVSKGMTEEQALKCLTDLYDGI